MELLSMIQNAKVQDLDGVEVAEVTAVTFVGGKMVITIDIETDLDFDEDDPDGGEEVDEDGEEEEEEVYEPNKEKVTVPLRMVVGQTNG